MAKIGIVLATYNGEKYLSQMLDSLVTQTRKADFIIAVDDGSKDNTPAILKSYQDRLPIKLTFLEKNSGHRAAFSKALELAQPQLYDNDLIALADQDDIWLPQKIETLEKEIESQKASLVFGDAQVIDAQGNIIEQSWRKLGSIQKKLSLKSLLTGFTNVTGCMTLFRAELLKRLLPIPEGVPVHDQWIALCASIENGIAAIDKPVIQYRIHDQNAIGIGHTHSWTGNLKLNLQWAKTIQGAAIYNSLSAEEKKFLNRYISYIQARLEKPFIPSYLFWVIRNMHSIYPHISNCTKFIPVIAYGILGAPIITRFGGKK